MNPLFFQVMSLFRPTELRQFLEKLGKRPSRRLSQNFIIDGNILNKIIALARVQASDTILEIGPGPGALTELLLKTGAQLIAIEKDSLFASSLERLDPTLSRLKVISEDFLSLNLEALLEDAPPVKVVANIPYNITTPIILSLIAQRKKIESITLMVQREVALRFIAKRGTPDYSSFTLLLQYYADVTFGFNVEPTCFYPPPTVRSAVVHFQFKKERKEPFPENLIRTAFKKRRKMMRSSLKELFPPHQIEEALLHLGHTSEARPEELSLEDFIALSSLLSTCSLS